MVGRYRPLSRTSTHINQNAIGSPRGELMAATGLRGMKIGAVSLWLLLLLSEKPMYGYEVIRELEKRFSGYWRPKTGTIYPAFEKLEEGGLVTSRIEFRDEGLDRKHYALTEKGRTELAQAMSHWTKMMEVLETYREVHESIFRYKDRLSKEDLSKARGARAGIGPAFRRPLQGPARSPEEDRGPADRAGDLQTLIR